MGCCGSIKIEGEDEFRDRMKMIASDDVRLRTYFNTTVSDEARRMTQYPLFVRSVRSDCNKATQLGQHIAHSALEWYEYALERSLDTNGIYTLRHDRNYIPTLLFTSHSSLIFWEEVIKGDVWVKSKTLGSACTVSITRKEYESCPIPVYSLRYNFNMPSAVRTKVSASSPPSISTTPVPVPL